VLSPVESIGKALEEEAMHPSASTKSRAEAGSGKWGVVLIKDFIPNSRGGADSAKPIEAWVPLGSTTKVANMADTQIWHSLIVGIAIREIHETLEWAQLASNPGFPLVDPHLHTPDLELVLANIRAGMLSVAK
jgi:hypothetical protein